MTALRLPLILAIARFWRLDRSRRVRAQTRDRQAHDYADVSARDIVSLTGTTVVFGHSGIPMSGGTVGGACRPAACEGDPGHESYYAFNPRTRYNEGTLSLGHALIVDGGGSYASVFVPAVRAQAADSAWRSTCSWATQSRMRSAIACWAPAIPTPG